MKRSGMRRFLSHTFLGAILALATAAPADAQEAVTLAFEGQVQIKDPNEIGLDPTGLAVGETFSVEITFDPTLVGNTGKTTLSLAAGTEITQDPSLEVTVNLGDLVVTNDDAVCCFTAGPSLFPFLNFEDGILVDVSILANKVDESTGDPIDLSLRTTGQQGFELNTIEVIAGGSDIQRLLKGIFLFDQAVAHCADGLDNDGDGFTDFQQDPGCDGSDDSSETSEFFECDNGLDDDADGRADFVLAGINGPDVDLGCGAPQSSENPQCQDGLDNDGDGYTDFDGGDPECKGRPSHFSEEVPAGSSESSSAGSSGGQKQASVCGLIGIEAAAILPLAFWRRRRHQRWTRG